MQCDYIQAENKSLDDIAQDCLKCGIAWMAVLDCTLHLDDPKLVQLYKINPFGEKMTITKESIGTLAMRMLASTSEGPLGVAQSNSEGQTDRAVSGGSGGELEIQVHYLDGGALVSGGKKQGSTLLMCSTFLLDFFLSYQAVP